MDIKTSIGQRIKDLRLKKGLSQEALANNAGIDRTYMTSVENGHRNISVLVLEKIIKALEISIAEFYNHPDFRNEK
jgi:transcriptional regulator with XRE-family HTH domain